MLSAPNATLKRYGSQGRGAWRLREGGDVRERHAVDRREARLVVVDEVQARAGRLDREAPKHACGAVGRRARDGVLGAEREQVVADLADEAERIRAWGVSKDVCKALVPAAQVEVRERCAVRADEERAVSLAPAVRERSDAGAVGRGECVLDAGHVVAPA